MNNKPCPHCNPTGVFKYGDERCELCHGKAYLPSTNNELVEQISKLIKLNEREKLLKQELSELTKNYDKQEELVFEMMFNLDVQSIEIDDKKVYRQINSFPRIVDQDSFFSWLKENGFSELIKETVNHNTLRSWYLDYIQSHEESELVDMIKVFEKKAIRIKRA